MVPQYPAMKSKKPRDKQRQARAKMGARKTTPRPHTQKPPKKPPAVARRPRKNAGRGKPRRVSSPDDRLALAARLARQGRIKQAFEDAENILADHPDHWQTLTFLSALFDRANHADAAVSFAQRAIEHAPDDAETRRILTINLAGSADNAGRPEAVIAACREFLDRYEPSADILGILFNFQRRMGCFRDALKTADEGIALFPDNPTLQHNRSAGLLDLGRGEEAVEAFGKVLRPYAGKPGDAPADVAAQYAALAEGYDDNHLHQSYGRMMAQTIIKTVGATGNKRVLDAGCGTGGLGTQIKAAHLVGIDLSPSMLAKARERGVYQELVEGDLAAEMAKRTDRFDIIASTGVLYHMADLAPFFREAARLLAPSGHLFFSTDPAPDSMDIGVSSPGEYAHSRAYVRRLAAESGFAEIAVKIMAHRGNPGFWWVLRRVGPAD